MESEKQEHEVESEKQEHEVEPENRNTKQKYKAEIHSRKTK